MKRRQPEKIEQAHIVAFLRQIGCAVCVIGHPSPSDGRSSRGTGQTPGIPDLWAFLPARGPVAAATGVWIEVKAAGGQLRPEQAAFRAQCEQCRVAHVVGGLDAVIAFLIDGGWVKSSSLPHYRQPKPAPVGAEGV
jgi:hypothetical protein